MHSAILSVGEALIDMVASEVDGAFMARPGGSPANVAVGLARLEIPTGLVARLADDLLGRQLRRYLERNGVDLSRVVHAAEPTSLAIVGLDGDGQAEYDFRIDGTADWHWEHHELADVLDPNVVALHTGSLAAILAPGADVLRQFLERMHGSVTISYDPNCRPALMGDPAGVHSRIRQLVALADIVKVSNHDLQWLAPDAGIETVAEEWLALGPSLVVGTRGPDGALAFAQGSGPIRRPGRRVLIRDTIGAGDSFTSALLAGLHRQGLLGASQRGRLSGIERNTLVAILDEAVLASALTCMRPGADPPTLDELRASSS